jgi:solute carrier family 1 (high affinity glutamate transporter) protein 2
LLILTILSVVAGALLGFLIRFAEPSRATVTLITFPGEILMNMLKMMILPLIIASLISGLYIHTKPFIYTQNVGLAQLDAKSSGRMGSIAIVYYLATTVIAACVSVLLCKQYETYEVYLQTGIVFVLLIHPGNPEVKQNLGSGTQTRDVSTVDTLLDLVRYKIYEKIRNGVNILCTGTCFQVI